MHYPRANSMFITNLNKVQYIPGGAKARNVRVTNPFGILYPTNLFRISKQPLYFKIFLLLLNFPFFSFYTNFFYKNGYSGPLSGSPRP